MLISDGNGAPKMALAGHGTAAQRARGRFALAAAAMALPEGSYELAGDLSGIAAVGALRFVVAYLSWRWRGFGE